MIGRVLTLVTLAGVWLGTTGGRLTGEQLVIVEAAEARLQRLERRVADTLKGEFPELTRATPLSRVDARRALERVLSAAGQAAPDRRAALLLAAHFLVVRLEPTDPPSREELDRSPRSDLERSEVIAGHRLRYVWGPLGAQWTSDHALMRAVWHDHPTTTWGEAAFVELLARGWRETPFCGDGPDEFRDVIREGERFLSGRPKSRVRRDVVTTLAWAYETWWSLSRAPASDPYVESPAPYAPGALTARQQAIAYYEQAFQLGLTGAVANDARARLVKLRRGIDTDQRIFHCVYD